MLYHALVLLIPVTILWAQTCEECDTCFIDVTGTASVPLLEYLAKTPLYVQAVSPSTQYQGVDSICFDFNNTIAQSTTILRTIFTKTDNSVVDLSYIEKEYDAGAFGGVGPTYPDYKESSAGIVATNDFTIAHPCDSVYVLKRCFRLGGLSPCPPGKQIPVFVLSTKKKEDNTSCIMQGIQTANMEEGALDFVSLPRKAKNPCPSLPSGGGGGSSGGGILGGGGGGLFGNDFGLLTVVDVPSIASFLF